MATMNRMQENRGENFKQIQGDSWLSTYLPAICAGAVMTIVLLLAISCSKKNDKPVAKVSPPSLPASTSPVSAAPAAVTPEAPKKVKKHRPTSATYVNSVYGVSFSYPRKFSLEAGGEKSSTPVEGELLKPGAMQVAAVKMPADSYPDTDFSAALVNVSVIPGMKGDECEQFLPSSKDGGTPKATTVKLGANEFTEIEQMSGEGEHQSDRKYFHLFKNGACYEFALAIETSRNADEELAQLDRGKVFQQLEKILASARIKEVELPGVESAQKPGDSPAADSPKTEKAQVVKPVEQN